MALRASCFTSVINEIIHGFLLQVHDIMSERMMKMCVLYIGGEKICEEKKNVLFFFSFSLFFLPCSLRKESKHQPKTFENNIV